MWPKLWGDGGDVEWRSLHPASISICHPSSRRFLLQWSEHCYSVGSKESHRIGHGSVPHRFALRILVLFCDIEFLTKFFTVVKLLAAGIFNSQT